MPLKKSPGTDALRPLKTIQDEQRLTPTPRRRPLPVPAPDIFEEPTVCVRVNRLWWSHVSGAIDVLSSEELWQGDAEEQARALRQIAKLLIPDEGCMPDFDCGDVEDCLETSTIINNIETNITNINNEITEIQDNAPIDDVVLPDTPTMPDSGNDLCRAANYIAVSLAAKLLELWEDAGVLTLQEFVGAFLGVVWWDYTKAKGFWQFALTISDPTLAEDAQAYIDQIKNHLFCNELDLAATIAAITADTSIPANENALWTAVLDNYTQSQIDEMGLIGVLGTDSPDCSEGCPWVIVFDFVGDYVPIGDETLIIPGNTWIPGNGDYVAGTGYVANADQMHLSKPLPEQCRLQHYYVSVRRGPSCSATDQRFLWRGPDGTGPEEYTSFFQRTTSATFVVQNFAVPGGPIMTAAQVMFDSFLCSGGSFEQTCNYIRLIGTGAYPQS